MKKLVVFAVITLFLMSFIAASMTTKAIENEDKENLIKLSNGNNSGDGSDDQNDESDDSSDDNDTLEANREDSNDSDDDENESSDDSSLRERLKDRIRAKLENAFCGTSTFAECNSDEDCITGGCSNAVCQGASEEPAITTCEFRECYNADAYEAKCKCIKNRCMWNRITEAQIRAIIAEKNRIRTGECPEECTCSGSTIKCILASGREMTVIAGNSGNVIVQVKGINASTNVTLYKSDDGKLYAVNKNNETIRVKLFPDHVREKIRERLQRHLEKENITLDERGIYLYKATKKAKLFFLFPADVEVTGEFDAETGRIIQIKNSWWAFLAKDDAETEAEVEVCTDNACCESKEFDYYNSETSECEFEED